MLSSSELHKDFLDFRILTTEIGVLGLKVCRTIKTDAIKALLYEPNNKTFSWTAVRPIEVEFFLSRENDFSFMVHIKAALSLTSLCRRCLDPVLHEEAMDFHIRMFEKEYLNEDKDHADWHFDSTEVDMSENDETVVGYFRDKCIDLGIILRDQIFLDLPDYPQCGSSRDVLSASSCKVLPLDDGDMRDNPFVKLLAKKK